MRVTKQKQDRKKAILASKASGFDKALAIHQEKVRKNQQQHITRQYYHQFYQTLVAHQEKHINSCLIHDLQGIPADDFMELCASFDKMNIRGERDAVKFIQAQARKSDSKKEKFYLHQDIQKQKQQEYEKSGKKIMKDLHSKSRGNEKDFKKIWEKKKKQLQQIIEMKNQQKFQLWAEIDKEIHQEREYKKKAKFLKIIRVETVQFILSVFEEICKIAEYRKQELIEVRKEKEKEESKQKEEENLKQKVDEKQQKISKEKPEQHSKQNLSLFSSPLQSRTLSVSIKTQLHLHLTHFVELIRYHLKEQSIEDMNLEEFSQMVLPIIELSQGWIKKTMNVLQSFIGFKQLEDTATPLFIEISQCFEVIKNDGQYEINHHAKQNAREILEKLTNKVRQILFLLDHIHKMI